MAPIRRYLRITKYSVLECRIYLDNPALGESWLLNSRNPILPRVIESVRPYVLPKLREENERKKGKGNKKKGVKDTVIEEDFEVSIFLTETSTRHSLLTKQKHFHDPSKKGLQSNSTKLTGNSNENAIEVEDASAILPPLVLRENSEDEPLDLQDLPEAEEDISDAGSLFVSEDERPRRSKRARPRDAVDSDVDSDSEMEPLSKRRKDGDVTEGDTDDKKKMAMNVTYDGFAIYGRVLCLIVKRKDKRAVNPAVMGGQAMMEDWIASTQNPPPELE